MEQHTLSVGVREKTGRGFSRRLRTQNKIPGVLYGLGRHCPVELDPITIERYLLQEGGRNIIFTLEGTGVSGRHAIIKEYQVHPVERNLIHVDLLEIDISKKILVTVAINYVGKAAGVAEGGVLQIIQRNVDLRCLPTNIPKHVDVDVTALKIGDSIHINQMILPEGIEKVAHLNPTLVTVVPPTKEEELQPVLSPTAEPEVITEKKEAKAEGEAGTAAPAEEKTDKSKEKKDKEEKKK